MTHLSDELQEYLTSNGLHPLKFHGVDHAWGYRENEPVFVFIIDSKNGFQDAMNLYWSTAEFISRPWCLIMGSKTPMNPGDKRILDNLASRYHIRVLENPSQDRFMTVVKEELSTLTSIMSRYIQPDSDNPSVSLGESINAWKDEGYFHKEIHSVSVDVGNLAIYEKSGELVPNRVTVPLTVHAGGEEIEGILLRLIQMDPPIFHTEHRNLPMVLSINLGNHSFTTRFETDKGNLVEATSYETLMRAFKCLKEISFINPNTSLSVFHLRKKLDD